MTKVLINYGKLKGRIAEKYGTRAAFAKALGIAESSLSAKLNNRGEFSQQEILLAVELLEIPGDRIDDFFFCPVAQ